MPNNPLLTINSLSIAFGKNEAEEKVVDGLSFSLERGKTLGIVGESGSGKSITSLCTMGLLHPSARILEGEIFFEKDKNQSINLLELDDSQMQKIRGKEIAMIFQEPMTSLNPVLKCGEQVAEAIRLHQKKDRKAAYQEVIRWFEEVKLPRAEQIYNAYPHQLSGGQKQRVMIAMAMCCEPKLLIADEPTTALDVTVQKQILKLIKQLQQKHEMAVIFITHDLGVVAEVADEVLVMQKGKKVESGTTEKIFSAAEHPYTKGLIACRPPTEFRLKRLPIIQDFLQLGNQTVASFIEPLKISVSERQEQLKLLMQEKAVLEVRDLKTHFPIKKGVFRKTVDWVKAVDGVSFDVKKGETLGLVGESGCGKTTLGRSILNLITPTSGDVIFEGTKLTDISSEQLRKYRKEIQLIFQDPYSSLNPKMRIGAAILEPMQVHKVEKSDKIRKEKVIELMETVGLQADQFNRYPHEFSGGQRQRICIARALALSPKFIICDESVSALDVSVQAQVLNLLNDLKNQFGFTYIFISHDLSVVKYMSDRMIVMQNGKIVESGLADEVYNNPQKAYTQELIDSIPKIKTEYTRA
jgi:peptide/nickel transport system ATP-binding protein